MKIIIRGGGKSNRIEYKKNVSFSFIHSFNKQEVQVLYRRFCDVWHRWENEYKLEHNKEDILPHRFFFGPKIHTMQDIYNDNPREVGKENNHHTDALSR